MKFEKISKKQYMRDIVGKFPIAYADIKLPKRGTAQSAGYDFFSVADITLLPGESIKLPTGIKFKCDSDKFLAAYPRSGHGFKYGIMLANTVGIIDADYYNNPDNEGEIFFQLINLSPFDIKLQKGETIGQGIIKPYLTTDDDAAAGERTGGFGSTGA